MVSMHFIRPLWLFALVPWGLLGISLLRQKPALLAWEQVCDAQLIKHLIAKNGKTTHTFAVSLMLASAFFMIISLAGPTWSRYLVPTYKQTLPTVFLLDLSSSMREKDLAPNRLARAKFKLHDLLKIKDAGQFALIAYSEAPFVVSPVTDDGETIDTLLPALTEDVLPVEGNRLDYALEKAEKLLKNSQSSTGNILVLTATIPSDAAINRASQLADEGYFVSVMPILKDSSSNSLFLPLSQAGRGTMLTLSDDQKDLNRFLKFKSNKKNYTINNKNEVYVWKDEGRWFLIPALLLFLPAFRRDWILRINT